MLRVLIFCGLLALVSSQSTPVNQCIVNSGPLPINTYIAGCTSTPCQLPSLSNVEFHMVFRTPHTIRSMRTLATAFLWGPVGASHSLGEQEVTCNYITNSYCPLLKDEVVTYTLVMFMEPSFPVGISVTIEFRVVDNDTDNAVVCIRVPVRIVSPLPSARVARGNSTTFV